MVETRQKRISPAQPFSFSVIIPCRNAVDTVSETVRTAFAQTVRPLEVIVVDDASTDGSAVAATGAGARVIRLERRCNAGGARNRGIEAAQGTALAFLDADAEIASDWLAHVQRVFHEDASIGAVGGRIHNGRPNCWGDLDLFLNHSEWISDRARMCDTYPTMAVVYRRDAVGAIRFPATNFGEDTFFAQAIRASGWRIWYEPRIRIVHKHVRLDFGSFWSRQIDAGQQLYWTRRSLDVPGKILVRAPVLLFLYPHLWIVLRRMVGRGMVGRALLLLPGLIGGETARIVGFFRARRVARGPAELKPDLAA